MSTEDKSVDLVAQARNTEAESLVKNYVIVSLGLGLIPVPAVDLAAFMALQVKLVHGLAKQYEVPFKANLGKSVLASLLSGGGSVLAVMGLSSLAKAVPVLGTLEGASVAISAGACTYAVGQVFLKHFESGGTLLNFDAKQTSGMFESKLKEGLDIARNLKKSKGDVPADTVATEETDSSTVSAAA